jgi:hypothetical protein
MNNYLTNLRHNLKKVFSFRSKINKNPKNLYCKNYDFVPLPSHYRSVTVFVTHGDTPSINVSLPSLTANYRPRSVSPFKITFKPFLTRMNEGQRQPERVIG